MNIATRSYVCNAFTPVDYNAAAVTGLRVPVRSAGHITLLLHAGDCTAQVITFTIYKHTLSAAGTSAAWTALSTTTGAENIWQKTATSDGALLTVDAWSRVVGATTSTFVTTASSGHSLIMELDPDTLGAHTDGTRFNHVSVDATDPGAASVGYGIWILSNYRYAKDLMSETLP